MPSDAKKREMQKRRKLPREKDRKKPQNPVVTNGEANGSAENGEETKPITNGASNGIASLNDAMDELALAAKHRSCTGVLASHLDARDVHINNLSILFHGAELLMESNLEL